MGLSHATRVRVAAHRVAFGEIVFERRSAAGLSMTELGELCGLSPATISRLEAGMSVSRTSVYRVCDVLLIPRELAHDCLYAYRQLPLPGF